MSTRCLFGELHISSVTLLWPWPNSCYSYIELHHFPLHCLYRTSLYCFCTSLCHCIIQADIKDPKPVYCFCDTIELTITAGDCKRLKLKSGGDFLLMLIQTKTLNPSQARKVIVSPYLLGFSWEFNGTKWAVFGGKRIHSTSYWKGSIVSAGIRTPDPWVAKRAIYHWANWIVDEWT